jgi:hypothetical protein
MLRTAIFALALLLPASTTWAQEQFLFRAGPISLDLPSTWQFKSDRGTIEGKGPNGEVAIVSIRRMRPEAPEEVRQQHMNTVRGFARDAMPNLAAKNGDVIQPVTETELPDGRVMFSAQTKTSRMFREGFFLQYLLASPSAMVYITFEGTGNSKDAAEYFSQVVAKHRWAE